MIDLLRRDSSWANQLFQNALKLVQRSLVFAGGITPESARRVNDISTSLNVARRFGFSVSDRNLRELATKIEQFLHNAPISVLAQDVFNSTSFKNEGLAGLKSGNNGLLDQVAKGCFRSNSDVHSKLGISGDGKTVIVSILENGLVLIVKTAGYFDRNLNEAYGLPSDAELARWACPLPNRKGYLIKLSEKNRGDTHQREEFIVTQSRGGPDGLNEHEGAIRSALIEMYRAQIVADNSNITQRIRRDDQQAPRVVRGVNLNWEDMWAAYLQYLYILGNNNLHPNGLLFKPGEEKGTLQVIGKTASETTPEDVINKARTNRDALIRSIHSTEQGGIVEFTAVLSLL
jgi:hypothetical protein